MEIVTTVGINQAMSHAEQVGVVRGELVKAADKTLRETGELMSQRQEAVEQAWSEDLSTTLSAFRDLVSATDRIPGIQDLLASGYEMQRYTDELAGSIQAHWGTWTRIIDLDMGAMPVPEEFREHLEQVDGTRPDPSLHTRSMLRLARRLPKPHRVERKLANWDLLRLWGIHAIVLLSICRETPDPRLSLDDISELRGEVEARVRAFRDRMHEIASDLDQRERATPDFSLGLWIEVHEAENWIREAGAQAVAGAFATATHATDTDSADAERYARDAAIVYDEIRKLLALLSGTRSVLRSYAIHDGDALSDFAAASHLPVSSATFDPARMSIPEATRADDGQNLEVAGMIQQTDFTPGGPQPRSLLTLGSPDGAQLTAFVPFMSMDSIGVKAGTWTQVRGEIFPDGKDDLSGPVLQVRRIRRREAATQSFFDFLIWAGRNEFELRPEQIDLIAGRRSGENSTAAELALRREWEGLPDE